MKPTIAELFLKELEAEEKATRECIERIPENLATFKPHDKSMPMGYLTLLLTDMPKWITAMIEQGEINFATWEKYTDASLKDAISRFDKNMSAAKNALKNVTDEKLEENSFTLKSGEQVLMHTPLIESISSTLNHWVHHRGQLTVYMRLNDIAVPSIYGPSADTKGF